MTSAVWQSRAAQAGAFVRRVIESRVFRTGFVLAAVALGVLLLASQWEGVRRDLSRLSAWSLVGSCAAATFALIATAGSVRAILADLGSRLTWKAAFRVFAIGQLGKYIPGTVWGILGPGEVAREYGVPRGRSATALLVVMVMTGGCATLLATFTLPFASSDAANTYWVVFVAAPVLLVCLHPKVVNAVLGWILRVTRRPPLEHALSWSGILKGMAWLISAWLGYGIALGVLVSSFGVGFGTSFVIGTGAFALAWIVGFLVVIAPAGAGVREVVLIAALAPVLDASTALLVALVDRAVITLVELSMAGLAVLLDRFRRSSL